MAETRGMKTALPDLVIGDFAVFCVVRAVRQPGEGLKLLKRAARSGEQRHLVDCLFENSLCVSHVWILSLGERRAGRRAERPGAATRTRPRKNLRPTGV